MLDTLKRQLLNYRDLVIDLYDKLETSADSVKALFANTIDNRQARENPVRLSHVIYTSQAVAWEDEIVTGGAIEELQFTVPMKGYDVFSAFNKVNIERPESLAKLEAMARPWPKAMERLQIKQILSVFRSNPLAYDGQNFFDPTTSTRSVMERTTTPCPRPFRARSQPSRSTRRRASSTRSWAASWSTSASRPRSFRPPRCRRTS
jgi:hypothetical protein